MGLLSKFKAILLESRPSVDQYALRNPKAPKPSPGQQEFRWITIGGEMGEDGHRHGGHPVQISSDGTMQTGHFAGKKVGEAFGHDERKKPAEPPHEMRKPYTHDADEIRAEIDKHKSKGIVHPTSAAILKGAEDYLAAGGMPRYRGEDRDTMQGLGQIPGHEAAVHRTNAITGRETQWIHPPAQQTGKAEGKPFHPVLSEQPKPQPTAGGIVMPTKSNAEAKDGDQLGLFGEATAPKREGPATVDLRPGEETKGKQKALFDTHGNADQMDLFGDGVMPDELVAKESRGSKAFDSAAEPAKMTVEKPTANDNAAAGLTPPAKAASAHDSVLDKGGTPREAAAAATKELDADYEFARASAVKNAGEDLKGSARHKVNAWKSLADAEKEGTAQELVTRDNLLKNEPTDIIVHADRNPLTALAMHYALRAFPGRPGTKAKGDHKKDREQYLDAYRSVKEKAEQLAKTLDSSDAKDAISKLQDHVAGLINKYRGVPPGGSSYMGSDKYNQTANDLVALHKALQSGWRANKTGVAGKLEEFARAAKERYGEFSKDTWGSISEHAKDIIEGHSLNKTFGKQSKATRRFDSADAYVKIARRTGGRDLSKIAEDPNKATNHMVSEMGLRGVQWGNSVSDEERKHHAGKALEALIDLAEVTGLHPKDIALDGKLGLAIGARGKGNASAHYEPDTQVINLTRSSGVGALAHEWGHAFDHSLNGYDFKSKASRSGATRRTGNYMSGDLDSHEITLPPEKQMAGRPAWKGTTDKPERMEKMGYIVTPRPLSNVRIAFQKLAEASKPYRDRLSAKLQQDVNAGLMSAAKANDYWNSDHEIFARSFERHVQHKLEKAGRENTYLAGFGGTHPYWPNQEETEKMADAFDAIMAEYRKEKHGSPDVVKFSQREARSVFNPLLVDCYSEATNV